MLKLQIDFHAWLWSFSLWNELPIVAFYTFTWLWTRYSSIETFTILFLTEWFFTITTFLSQATRVDTLFFYILLGLLYNLLILIDVLTLTTDTVIVTCFAIGETFTVHFQTKGFFTCTTDTFFLSRTCSGLLFFEPNSKRILFLWLMILIIVMIKKMVWIDMNIFLCGDKLKRIIKMKLWYWGNVKCWQSRKNKLILILFTLLLHVNKIILITSQLLLLLVRKLFIFYKSKRDGIKFK